MAETGKGKKKSKKAKANQKPVKNDLQTATVIWEARLAAAEKALTEYKNHCSRLSAENERLQQEMTQTEKDTIEVITFLRRESDKKDEHISKIQKDMKRYKRDSQKTKDSLAEDYVNQLSKLEEQFNDKENELRLMQAELKVVKEFRKKRTQMQKELDQIKSSMLDMKHRHNDTTQKMEHKFFEDKVRLQKEANKRITELAEKAHEEAVGNLNDTTRTIFTENVRMSEALRFHVLEGEELKREKMKLSGKAARLEEEKEMHDLIVKEKVAQSRKQAQSIEQLNSKVASLEHALGQVVRDFERDRTLASAENNNKIGQYQQEVEGLRRVLDMKTRENHQMKRLAKDIVKARTELEQFFLDSLEFVKQEIVKQRELYKQESKVVFNAQMRHATVQSAVLGSVAQFPAIRTYRPSNTSTNSIQMDFEEAERRGFVSKDAQNTRVDIRDLTWEERERILRLVFARVNGINISAENDLRSETSHDPKNSNGGTPRAPTQYSGRPSQESSRGVLLPVRAITSTAGSSSDVQQHLVDTTSIGGGSAGGITNGGSTFLTDLVA